MTYAKVTMTMRDLDRLKCIRAVIDRQLKVYQAAERLGLTSRQILRLVRREPAEGPIGLISNQRDRPGDHGGLKPALARRLLAILGINISPRAHSVRRQSQNLARQLKQQQTNYEARLSRRCPG